MKAPCDNCPWRKDAPVGHWDPTHFESIWRTCQDDGQALMLCHKSRGRNKIPCAGAIVVVGFESIGLRLAVLSKRIDTAQYGSTVPLYSNFEEMLLANGVTPPRRNRFIDDGQQYGDRDSPPGVEGAHRRSKPTDGPTPIHQKNRRPARKGGTRR